MTRHERITPPADPVTATNCPLPKAVREALALVEQATELLVQADAKLSGLYTYDEKDGTRFPAEDSCEAAALTDALDDYRIYIRDRVEMKRYSGRVA